jgi:hypothetical protein
MARRTTTLVALTLLGSCRLFEQCNKRLSEAVSPSGRFSAGVYESGNCISSLNTVVTDVTIMDNSALLRRTYTPFTIKGADSVTVTWEGNRKLVVEFVIPGVTSDHIFRSDPEWRGIAISYRQLSRP